LEKDVEAGLRMAAALRLFWEVRGFAGDADEWLSQLLLQPQAQTPSLTRAKALLAYAAFMSGTQDVFTRARQLAEESLALYRDLGNRQGMALSLLNLGEATARLGNAAAGRSLLEESVALFRELRYKPGLAWALTSLGQVASNQDAARGRLVLEESLAIGRALGDQIGMSHTLMLLGTLALRQGDYATAQGWLEESLAIHRRLGNASAVYSLIGLGELAFHRGDYEQARSYYEESRLLNKQAGQNTEDPWLLARRGYTALRQGDIEGARTMFEQSLTGFKGGGNKIGIVFVLEGLASLAVAQTMPELALRLFAWADATREVIDDMRPPVEQVDVDRDLVTIRTQLDETAIAAVRAEGRDMTLEQAITYGLSVD
jgi:tetratricopeptide (TPR) repeat protein